MQAGDSDSQANHEDGKERVTSRATISHPCTFSLREAWLLMEESGAVESRGWVCRSARVGVSLTARGRVRVSAPRRWLHVCGYETVAVRDKVVR